MHADRNGATIEGYINRNNVVPAAARGGASDGALPRPESGKHRHAQLDRGWARRRRYDGLPVGPSTLQLGQAIRARRKLRGLSQAALARRAEVHRSHLMRVEAGETQLGWTLLGRIANALCMPASSLARSAERSHAELSSAGASPSQHIEPLTVVAPAPSGAELGSAVRRLRRAKAMSIEVLALSVGLHPTSVQKIERNERRPTWSTLCDLAAALGLSVSALIAEAEHEARSRR